MNKQTIFKRFAAWITNSVFIIVLNQSYGCFATQSKMAMTMMMMINDRNSSTQRIIELFLFKYIAIIYVNTSGPGVGALGPRVRCIVNFAMNKVETEREMKTSTIQFQSVGLDSVAFTVCHPKLGLEY